MNDISERAKRDVLNAIEPCNRVGPRGRHYVDSVWEPDSHRTNISDNRHKLIAGKISRARALTSAERGIIDRPAPSVKI